VFKRYENRISIRIYINYKFRWLYIDGFSHFGVGTPRQHPQHAISIKQLLFSVRYILRGNIRKIYITSLHVELL